MPRDRNGYEPDDEPRRATATGGVPVWVWALAAAGVLGMMSCGGVGVMWFVAAERNRDRLVEADRRERQAADEAARGEAAGKGKAAAGGADPTGVPHVSVDEIAAAYQADPNAADARYKGKRLRVEITARKSGDGWVGAVAQLTPPQIRKTSAAQAAREHQEAALRGWVPNVVFLAPTGRVEDHKRAVIEGTCAGIAPDPATGVKLTFTDARIIASGGE